MNEILIRKHMKEVQRFGINKEVAHDIVQTAYEAGKGKNIEMYIHYAIDLTYGMGFTKRFAK